MCFRFISNSSRYNTSSVIIYFLEKNNNKKLHLESAKIYNPPEITLRKGRFKGYPFRSYSFTNYTGGFSEHYPAYLILSVSNF